MRAGIAFANYHTRRLGAVTSDHNLRQKIHGIDLWMEREDYRDIRKLGTGSLLLKQVWSHRQRDCSESVEHIYAQYAAYFIKDDRSLRTLSLCTLGERQREIPSRAPDWTIDTAVGPSRSLTQWYTPGLHKFSASADKIHFVQDSGHPKFEHSGVSLDFKVLHTQGIQCFTISTNGDVVQDGKARPGSVSQEMWKRLRTWLSLVQEHVADPYHTGESRSEATWRTVVANVSSDGHLAQEEVQGLGFHIWSRLPESGDELKEPEAQKCMIQFMGAASSATFARRLFFTQEGYMGLAPKCARVGDQVCVLFGAEAPYVLRRKGDAFEVIGECYCHGIMYGEMLSTGYRLQTLKIV